MVRFFKAITSHKLRTAIAAIVLIGGWYSFFYTSTPTAAPRYVIAKPEKGTLITSVSGTGQVSVSSQVDIKSKTSGDIVAISVKNGEYVRAGSLIAQLDARDARNAVRDAEVNLAAAKVSYQKTSESATSQKKDQLKAIRDAETNLESAKIALEKLKKPADTLSILQAENAVAQADEAQKKTKDDLQKSYQDGFGKVVDAFIDMSETMTGLKALFFDNTIESNQDNIDWYLNQVSYTGNDTSRSGALQNKDQFYKAYQKALASYDVNFSAYKKVNLSSKPADIQSLIFQTYESEKDIAEALKEGSDYIAYIKNAIQNHNNSPAVPAIITTHQAQLNSYITTMNAHTSNLLTVTTGIQNSENAFVSADRTIAEKKESLAKLKTGADILDIQSAELTVRQRQNALVDAKDKLDINTQLDVDSARLTLQQRQNALADAREKLSDSSILAPFDGVIAKIDLKKGDSLASGGAVANLITQQKIAEISLNEVDVSKIKIGQKATLTFDALENLSLTGEVAEIDTLGTVSQGVVTYNVKIGFDAQDDRVKGGMTVSAAIITEAKQDILMVPNSAIQQDDGGASVDVVDEKIADRNPGNTAGILLGTLPRSQSVQIGIANDEMTEIVSGLTGTENIVVRIISGSATTPASSSSGGLSIPGLGGRSGAGALRGR